MAIYNLLRAAPILLVILNANQPISCQDHRSGDANNSLDHPKRIQDTSSNNETLSETVQQVYTRANKMRMLGLNFHSYRPDAKFVGDPSFVDSSSEAHKRRCAHHLGQYEKALRTHAELDPFTATSSMEPSRLADAFGRPGAGVFEGNQFWLGSYDECLSLTLRHNLTEPIKAQYCLGMAQFTGWQPQQDKTSIKVGLCLPETCTSSMINDNLDMLATVETMMKYQFGSGQPYTKLKLWEVYCLPHATSPIRQYSTSAICCLTVLGLLVAANLLATIIDCSGFDFKDKSQARNWQTIIVESFSIKKNLEKFFHIRDESFAAKALRSGKPLEESDKGNSFDIGAVFNTINGVKCVGMAMIIAGHNGLGAPVVSRNIFYYDTLNVSVIGTIVLTAHLMVDTFFALSGMLASYLIFKKGVAGAATLKGWIILILHRYWRLAPIYLITYWFCKSVGDLIGSGPFWDYMTAEDSFRYDCSKESWLVPLLFLNDFQDSMYKHCLPAAWFLANAFKFGLITPILVFIIYKSMRRGYTTIILTVIANMALVTVLTAYTDIDFKPIMHFKPQAMRDMMYELVEVYIRPYSRISPYLIGLIAGHLMYLVETNKLKVNLSQGLERIIWFGFISISLSLACLPWVGRALVLPDEFIPWVVGIVFALARPSWALCTCWLVFAMARGQVAWLANFLSAKCWQILGKLIFCGYLIHVEILFQWYCSLTAPFSTTYQDLFAGAATSIFIVSCVSFVMVLLLEYPICALEELFLPKFLNDVLPPSKQTHSIARKIGVTPSP